MVERGRWHDLGGGVRALATVHPAWVLRQSAESSEAAFHEFVRDLQGLKDALERE